MSEIEAESDDVILMETATEEELGLEEVANGAETKEEEEKVEEKKEEEDEEKEFYCSVCDVQCLNQDQFVNHTRTMMHTQNLMIEEEAEKRKAKRRQAEKEQEEEEMMTYLEYYCDVCMIRMTGLKPYEDHMRGERHKKNVARADAGVVPIRRKKKGADDVNLEPGAIRCQPVLDACKEPLVGLQYIKELVNKDPEIEERYHCELCDMKSDPRTLITHVIGLKHRANYFREHFMNYHVMLRQGNRKKSEQTEMAEEYAAAIEAEEGRRKPEQVVEDNPYYDPDRLKTLSNEVPAGFGAATKKERRPLHKRYERDEYRSSRSWGREGSYDRERDPDPRYPRSRYENRVEMPRSTRLDPRYPRSRYEREEEEYPRRHREEQMRYKRREGSEEDYYHRDWEEPQLRRRRLEEPYEESRLWSRPESGVDALLDSLASSLPGHRYPRDSQDEMLVALLEAALEKDERKQMPTAGYTGTPQYGYGGHPDQQRREPSYPAQFSENPYNQPRGAPNQPNQYSENMYNQARGAPNQPTQYGGNRFNQPSGSPNQPSQYGGNRFNQPSGAPNQPAQFGGNRFNQPSGAPNQPAQYGGNRFSQSSGTPNQPTQYGGNRFNQPSGTPNQPSQYGGNKFNQPSGTQNQPTLYGENRFNQPGGAANQGRGRAAPARPGVNFGGPDFGRPKQPGHPFSVKPPVDDDEDEVGEEEFERLLAKGFGRY